MRLSLATAARFFSALVLTFAMLQAGLAQERGPRVEVVCPAPPIPVKVEDKQALVYELHVTNFDVVPLTLKRLEISADTDKSQPLKIITDDALSAIMTEAGSTSGAKARSDHWARQTRRHFPVDELGPDRRTPVSLRHRMVFVAGLPSEGSAPTETTLEDFPVAVRSGCSALAQSSVRWWRLGCGDGPCERFGASAEYLRH